TFACQTITGGSLPVTATVQADAAVFPEAAATRETFAVTISGKADPLANPPVCVVTAPAQLSVPTGAAKVTTALHRLASTLATMFDGQLITGAVVSVTVKVVVQVALLPVASVAVTVIVCPPSPTSV